MHAEVKSLQYFGNRLEILPNIRLILILWWVWYNRCDLHLLVVKSLRLNYILITVITGKYIFILFAGNIPIRMLLSWLNYQSLEFK